MTLDARSSENPRAKRARSKQRLAPSTVKESASGLVEKLHLVDGQYLKRAAVLLFHPNPVRFFTGAFVKIGYFRTNSDLLIPDEVHGDLFLQVDKATGFLMTKSEGKAFLSTLQSGYRKRVFFRAGLIEAWGRGIERMLDACKEAGTPEPQIRCEANGLWLDFGFPPMDAASITQEKLLRC